MAEYRRIITDLFGEDGFSEDEQTIKEQRALEKRLKDALGSDSESEEMTERWDDTSMSGDEDDYAADVIDLAHSDLDDEPVQLQIGRISVERVGDDEKRHAKALAQFQRQMAACIRKRRCEEEVNQYGMEVFQHAEEILRTKNLIEATMASISAEPTMTNNQPTIFKDTDPEETTPRLPRAERRTAAKRAWYKRKK